MRNKLVQAVLLLGLFSVASFGVVAFTVPGFNASRPSLEPTGLAKPIADLRDYNGTYEGSVGTGSIGFSGGTLYRDNEDNGATSGCVGEGCGRHPGVDIPVPIGTRVFAATSGIVAISRCEDSWGGLIVIQSQNPWNPSETIYVIYAHLSRRQYASGIAVEQGQYVTVGTEIGRSGGDPNLVKCSGNSTGAHLHFQIDKDDGSPEPWYPSGGQLNQRDDNYLVTTKTYNPIVFLTGGYRWTFGQNGNRELWDLFNWQSWGVSNHALYVDAGYDPYISRGGLTNCGRSRPCSSAVAAEASAYRQVYLDLYNYCTTGVGKLYFTTSTSPSWSEDKTVAFLTRSGSQRTHVWMAGHWRWTGIITGLRVDPAENCQPGIWDPTYYGEITLER